ncbi:MAG: bacterioferritin [Gammaproteobacteria bacterium]|nr:bacterioferritin [Gammaproteobacteria bacterium]
MLFASADQQVLGFLGRALSLEMTAVQQYATQAKLVSAWGLAEDASKLQQESLEEMGHVERIISRMLALGAAPNASMLRPVKLGANLRDLLLADAELEKDLVELYSQAAHHCARNGDHDNRKFFEELLHEEQAHDVALSTWIKEIETPETSQSSRVTF